MIEKEQVIYWISNNQGKKLATLNLKDKMYRFWSPHSSKLAAAISNGLEIFPFFKKTHILYIDPNSSINVNHLLNIIGKEGKIYLQSKKYVNSLENQKILSPNLEYIVDDNSKKIEKVDLMYIDLPNENFYQIIENYEKFLKNEGFIIFIVNSTEFFKSTSSDDTQINSYNSLKSRYNILQEVFLDEFFKKQTLIIAQFINKN
jgi:fibrillarin-like pre-rRNA processing protein